MESSHHHKPNGQPSESHHSSSNPAGQYTIPDNFANLNEVAAPPPVENPQEEHVYRYSSLEESRTREQNYAHAGTGDSRKYYDHIDRNMDLADMKHSRCIPFIALRAYLRSLWPSH
jgi:hypothetical protein